MHCSPHTSYLEATINPATGSYFLPKVTVKLFGEEDEGALTLGGYLREAYQEARRFASFSRNGLKVLDSSRPCCYDDLAVPWKLGAVRS